MIYTFEVCPAGKYVNAFRLRKGFTVWDSLSNQYITANDTLEDYRHYYDDNVGSLWYFGTGKVKSTDRHAYPDEGSQGGYSYVLRPQDTKFLQYYRTDELHNVELFSNRYKYSHNNTDLCDRSYEGTICGTAQSTGENSIPDADWRTYKGLYLGESIPLLGIVEQHIEPSEILGVPIYDKQVNTSDTLKYGTVASASLTFNLDKNVNDTKQYNNQLLVLFYDFKNKNQWERLGFFRIDNIEAIDEFSTSIVAHDETYKLNKYVDDFLEGYTQATTLDQFYRDLLDYCGCFYDTHQPTIHNGSLAMSNVYHAVKTTGVQVAHYVANLSPGFIHTNIDGDIVLSQYQMKDNNLTKADYARLTYCAYNTDMLDKIKIVSSNAVKGESNGNGQNVYFLADNPLLSELQATSYFNNLANNIYSIYNNIPTYRPATINFLVLPRGLEIGDIVGLTTQKGEDYNVIIMAMNISSSGIEVRSFGTQKYPVEAESNSEFVNLINDMGEISGDVSNMLEAQQTMATAIGINTSNIADMQPVVNSHSTQIANLQSSVNGYGITTSNNLSTIKLNGTTSNFAMKGYVDTLRSYVDTQDTSVLNTSKAYADSLVGTALSYRTGTIRWSMSSSGTVKSCHCIFIGTNDKRNGLFIPTEFITDDNNRTHLWRIYNNNYYVLYGETSGTGYREGWFEAYNASFTED